MTSRGQFITLEGIEGAGKSTMVTFITDLLTQSGREVVVTREPGGTLIGEQLREILLDKTNDELTDDTELMIIFAARSQHLEQVIKPALDQGKDVLCDRFTDASFAYQGGGRGMDSTRIETLETWVQQGIRPDLTLLFDLEVSVGLHRASKRSEADRFEREHIDFFERTRQCYLERARAEPARFATVDAENDIESVQAQIRQILASRQLC